MTIIDSHVHFSDPRLLPELKEYLSAFERLGLLSLPVPDVHSFNVALLEAHRSAPDRVDLFASFDHGRSGAALRRAAASRTLAEQVEQYARIGFGGLKLWEGKPTLQAELRVALDAPPFLDAYHAAADAAMPVLIHVADPPAFWHARGGPWSYVDSDVPAFTELQRQAAAICDASARTTFIFPHLLFMADDLDLMERFLDDHTNALLDLAPGNYFYSALGAEDANGGVRRTRARSVLTRYAERIIFGTDAMFFPPGVDGLPPVTLDENRLRASRLITFLTTDDAVDNPYPLTAEACPTVRGLALDTDALEHVLGGTYRRLMGEAPRHIDAVAAEEYRRFAAEAGQ